MVKFGKFITKHKLFILILGVLLIIPSMIGMVKTRVNYDVLSYLPDSLETVSGQDIMVDEFGMGAFSMVIVENMDNKDVDSDIFYESDGRLYTDGNGWNEADFRLRCGNPSDNGVRHDQLKTENPLYEPYRAEYRA